MNKVILMGRLTRDPEMRYSNAAEPLAIVRYTLAVDRRVSRERRDAGEQTADFVNCTAFGRAAEFVERYFRKGQMVSVVGRLQVRSYDDPQSGQRRWSTEVVTDEHFFAESRASFESRGQGGGQNPNYNDSYGSGHMPPPQPANLAPPQQQNPASDSFFEVDTGAVPALDDDDLPF